MSDVPRAPTVGALAITTVAPTVWAGGITVVEAPASAYHLGHKLSNRGLASHTMYTALTVQNIILNIKTAVGVVPGNVTVIGFLVKSSDMDTGSPALVQSIYLGDTAVATGVTTGQGGTSAFVPCTPTALTAETTCYLKTTTAAATPAAGTVYVTAVYYSS